MELTLNLKKQISEYALANADIEVCGFVMADGSIKPVENVADTFSIEELKAMGLTIESDNPDPRASLFVMPDWGNKFFIDNYDSITDVFHSHCLDSAPGYLSPTDIHNSIASKKGYILYHCHPDIDAWDYFNPNELHPYPLQNKKKFNPKQLDFYLGWPYSHPRCDCLTLFRAYFKGMFGISIRDYPRPKDPLEYFKGHWDAYRQNLQKEDFVQVNASQLQPNDVVLTTLRGRTPHHIAILLEPSTGKALHVLEPGRLSETFVYGGRDWLASTDSYWRHRSFIHAN